MKALCVDSVLVVTVIHIMMASSHHIAPHDRLKRQTNEHSKKVVCYFVNWAQYRPGTGRHTVTDIEPNMCTHLIYAFAKLDGTNIAIFELNDVETYKKFNDLKMTNPSLKTLLSVGGDTQAVSGFRHVASIPANRAVFAQNARAYLRQHGFDGLDVDWEFPAAEDRDNFTELVKSLREEFSQESVSSDKTELLLTCALGAATDTITQGYNLQHVSQYIDFGNVMAYDLHGGWDNLTGFQAALSGYAHFDVFNQKSVVQMYITEGLAKEKLVLGIPTYGRTFTLCDPDQHGLRQCAVGHGKVGPYSNSPGILTYYEICNKGWSRVYDEEQQSPYTYSGDQWVGYDDTKSVQAKMEYIIAESLAGAMFWDLSMDDFSGTCGEGNYPLTAMSKLINSGTATTSNPYITTDPTTNAATTITTTTTTTTTTTSPTRPRTSTVFSERPWWMETSCSVHINIHWTLILLSLIISSHSLPLF